ncbi:MAG: Polyprenyl synthetase superfamily [Candidatus Woesebacteria bacterium GW2011_GWA1_39_21]|uniref:Polyprenyl synthetase superfamily n=1 Tax=Candidatus Woesebacteria bacterium GW2011_GWA1_39_21 TaxID=1618550 RepID=A0A0G0QMM4_9BACT|nr:MAG: Polyprenyl synthetase superfamily [Candidatus Woesebacteria bacterium GW2011_GWA1_39_21]
MNVKSYLKEYIVRADAFMASYIARKILEVQDVGKNSKGGLVAVDMLERYKNFCLGGKKLRGGIIQLGYELSGGKKEDVLGASSSIEFIHSFLLMHDDIQDMDFLRRGQPTIHKQYESKHEEMKFKKDFKLYGTSMGINMGDLGAYMGMEVILSSSLDESRKLEASIYFSRLLQRVAFGQGLDVTYEQLPKVTEADVMELHLQKTSVYTVGGPLKIGAILGGLPKKNINAIEKYGEPIGIAFQLRDDELGLFSSEQELGKPIGSDIREGKNTILKIKAIEKTKGKDREFLMKAYGDRNISKKAVDKVRDLTVKTGAYDYSKKLAKKLVADGKKFIPQITKDLYFQDALSSFADFMIERGS